MVVADKTVLAETVNLPRETAPEIAITNYIHLEPSFNLLTPTPGASPEKKGKVRQPR